MIRITIEEDFGAPVVLKWGYEVMVPMSFGPATPEMMTDFRGPRDPLPARALQWELDFRDPRKRSVVMQDDMVAVQYFGDSRAASSEHPLVRDKKVPNFNDERIRVAMVWGDYVYSDKYGPYTSVRIRVPQIPRVVVHRADSAGEAIESESFRPHEFFRWEDMLVGDHAAQYADMVARHRPHLAPASVDLSQVDFSKLSDEQMEQLAAAFRRVQRAKVS